MPEQFDGGRAVAGVGGIVLLVSLFLDWFTGGLVRGGGGVTAWEAFEVLDLVLAAIAIIVIVHALPPVAQAVRAPQAGSGILAGLGIAAFVIVAAALLNHPPTVFGDPTTGAWLALGGSALMAIGGILGAARVSIAVSVRPRAGPTDRRRTTVAEPPPSEPYDSESETRPFPETGRG
jgi:hypothetical protein